MKMFKEMSIRQLRAWIDNAHAVREYDSYFDAATRELNNRTSSPVSKQKRAKNPNTRTSSDVRSPTRTSTKANPNSKIKLKANELSFIRDCEAFYVGNISWNPTVTNMTSYGIPSKRALLLMDIAQANVDRKSNPALRHGTASPRRRSQITKAPPSKRLVLRRMENSKKGYFPNPMAMYNKWAVIQKAPSGKIVKVCETDVTEHAQVIASLLNTKAAKGAKFYVTENSITPFVD